jgi:hypothetical protein
MMTLMHYSWFISLLGDRVNLLERAAVATRATRLREVNLIATLTLAMLFHGQEANRADVLVSAVHAPS